LPRRLGSDRDDDDTPPDSRSRECQGGDDDDDDEEEEEDDDDEDAEEPGGGFDGKDDGEDRWCLLEDDGDVDALLSLWIVSSTRHSRRIIIFSDVSG